MPRGRRLERAPARVRPGREVGRLAGVALLAVRVPLHRVDQVAEEGRLFGDGRAVRGLPLDGATGSTTTVAPRPVPFTLTASARVRGGMPAVYFHRGTTFGSGAAATARSSCMRHSGILVFEEGFQ